MPPACHRWSGAARGHLAQSRAIVSPMKLIKRKNTEEISTEREVARSIGMGRIGLGVATIVAPGAVQKIVAGHEGSDKGIWLRMFGVREIFIGAAALHPNEIIWRTTLRYGIAMDAADAAAIVASAKRGAPQRAVIPGAAIAAGAALAGALGPAYLRRTRA